MKEFTPILFMLLIFAAIITDSAAALTIGAAGMFTSLTILIATADGRTKK